MSVPSLPFVPARGLMRGLLAGAIAGGLLFLVGLFVDPTAAWSGYLMGFVLFVSLALAGGLFVSLLTLAGGRWATALRRIPEAMTGALPVGALLAVLLIGGVTSLYEWSHAAVVEDDWILQAKSIYLNRLGFAVRIGIFFALWILLSRAMVSASRRQDADGDPEHSRRLVKRAALFLPVFAVTFSFASFDWLMSLEPHWFSTIYALVTLSGLGTSGLAVCILFAVLLRRGPLRSVVRDDHLDDMGKIGIGLALFWGYIWYCQYMLIWYTNMPEETPYYVLRSTGGWRVLTWVALALNWAIPFFALMPKRARRSGPVLVRIAWVMIAGQVVQLFLLVQPGLHFEDPALTAWTLGPPLGALCLFLWLTLRSLGQAPLVPARDPALPESLSHHC
jgi:hypothetical protein